MKKCIPILLSALILIIFSSVGAQDNTQTATSATKTQFADGTVAAALGNAFRQGDDYPILESPVITGVESLMPSPVSRKVLRDGQLLIERDGMLYTLQGQVVR